jgi:hypothetical protein
VTLPRCMPACAAVYLVVSAGASALAAASLVGRGVADQLGDGDDHRCHGVVRIRPD